MAINRRQRLDNMYSRAALRVALVCLFQSGDPQSHVALMLINITRINSRQEQRRVARRCGSSRCSGLSTATPHCPKHTHIARSYNDKIYIQTNSYFAEQHGAARAVLSHASVFSAILMDGRPTAVFCCSFAYTCGLAVVLCDQTNIDVV